MKSLNSVDITVYLESTRFKTQDDVIARGSGPNERRTCAPPFNTATEIAYRISIINLFHVNEWGKPKSDVIVILVFLLFKGFI